MVGWSHANRQVSLTETRHVERRGSMGGEEFGDAELVCAGGNICLAPAGDFPFGSEASGETFPDPSSNMPEPVSD